MPARSIAEIVASLPLPGTAALPAPTYLPPADFSQVLVGDAPVERGVALAVESMRRHMTSEGWEIMAGLEHAGYALAGADLVTKSTAGDTYVQQRPNLTDVPEILDFCKPSVVVVQDKREWEGLTADRSRDPRMRFTNVRVLKARPDIFKLTVLKDAQHNPDYHRTSADEIGCHAWIVYYAPDIVCRLAPFVRKEHCVRTWHTVDRALVPTYRAEGRKGCLLSGALSSVYPLRQRLTKYAKLLPDVNLLPHPGYHRAGCATPSFLQDLSRYKVAICTSSIYGYSLRKLVEASAAGCRVVTDLPIDDVIPGIDSNLFRVRPDIQLTQMNKILRRLYDTYDPKTQEEVSRKAIELFDYNAEGRRLAAAIEQLRSSYAQ